MILKYCKYKKSEMTGHFGLKLVRLFIAESQNVDF